MNCCFRQSLVWLGLTGAAFWMGCASTGPQSLQFPEPVSGPVYPLPEGIDSLLARHAAAKAETLFVSLEYEKKANQWIESSRSLFRIYSEVQKFTEVLDTLKSKETGIQFLNALDIPESNRERFRFILHSQDAAGMSGFLRKDNQERLLRIKTLLENAHRHNPYNLSILSDLSRAAFLLGKTAPDTASVRTCFEYAAASLMKAYRLDRGNHRILYRLGETFMSLNDWGRANLCFQKAFKALRAFDFLQEQIQDFHQPAALDSITAFEYLASITLSYIRMYNAQEALGTLARADSFAAGSDQQKLLKEYRFLIGWAEGDIRARELFVDAKRLANEGYPLHSAQLYLEVLKRTQQTAKAAFFESSYHLSMIEFQSLMENRGYQKRIGLENMGPDRLRRLIAAIPKDSLGVPINSIYHEYFDTYGTMLYNQGIRALENHETVPALILFTQGALVSSASQSRLSLELLKLIFHHGPYAYPWVFHMYRFKNRLTHEEICQMYPLLREICRRTNNPILSEYFHEEFEAFLSDRIIQFDHEKRIMAYEFLRSGFQAMNEYFKSTFQYSGSGAWISFYDNAYRKSEENRPDKNLIRSAIQSIYEGMADEKWSRIWLDRLKQLRETSG